MPRGSPQASQACAAISSSRDDETAGFRHKTIACGAVKRSFGSISLAFIWLVRELVGCLGTCTGRLVPLGLRCLGVIYSNPVTP
jgi:hypothetical protein